tara:strand:+ start:423 stop:698 length:276 start_codon:yes stop_codon:yes gene_type:complete
MPLGIEEVVLAIILATLAAIVYSLRVLVILERRIARIDLNMERISERILLEEGRIEKALHIKPLRSSKRAAKKPAKKRKAKKAKTKKRKKR